MQLTVREAAQLLQVPEEAIYRWIREKGLPAVRFNEQVRINRVGLAEWAQEHRLTLLPESPTKHRQRLPTLADALAAGGIHHGIRGANKREVLAAVVQRLRLPENVDRAFLIDMLMAREDQGSTGFGDGIALPHVRNPIVIDIDEPAITLCYLDEPVDFGAIDGVPVFALFTMLNPTIRIHLHLLSRLAWALRRAEFVALLKARAGAEEILAEARRSAHDSRAGPHGTSPARGGTR